MHAETETLVATTDRPEADARDEARAKLIRDVIAEIRPNLQRDGGDCELLEVRGNKAMVRMTGACVFCKLSSATIEGIQAKVVEKLGEFIRLVPVMGGVKL